MVVQYSDEIGDPKGPENMTYIWVKCGAFYDRQTPLNNSCSEVK